MRAILVAHSNRSPSIDDLFFVMSRPVSLLCVVALAFSACEPGPIVEWTDEYPVTITTAATDAQLTVSRNGVASVAPAQAERVVTQGPVCPGTVRVASDGLGGAFAAWWAPRENGSATLVVAHRQAGTDSVWAPPVTADARDRSPVGCNRPPPAIAADGARGYVHLAYYLDAPEGAGIWGGHSMERGTYFHGPMAVVYGDRPGRTAIATSGDVVVIAYEDPNSVRTHIALAISETAGHLFEHRLGMVSPASAVATDPQVAIADRFIAVGWSAEDWGKGEAASATRVTRIGMLGDIVRTQGGKIEADRRPHDR